MKILFALACVGFLISALVHLSTYFGIDPSEPFPYIWLLHIGVLVIFTPCISIVLTLFPKDEKGHLKMGTGAPKWMKWVTGVAGALVAGNFVLFIIVMLFWGWGAIRNGQYVQENVHGQIVRQITAGEYHQYNAGGIHFFSSGWLFFYSGGMTILASAIAYRKLGGTPSFSTKEQADDASQRAQDLRQAAVLGIGFMSGPCIILATATVFHVGSGFIATIISVIYIPSAIPGYLIAHRLLQEKVPEMCPKCGGRIIVVGKPWMQFRCAHCDWTS